MSATADDVAATTANAPPVADANETEPKQGAESAPAVTDADESPSKVLDPVQKRIDELTRRRYEAERRADQIAADRDEWRDRAMRVEKPAPVEEPAAADDDKTLADFGYDEAKYKAHLRAIARAEAVKAAEGVLSQKQTQEARTQIVVAHRSREATFSKNVPDYFEIAHHAPITNSMAEIVMESENSAALAYYLGKNPEVAVRISQLPERQQARELGRIEASKLSDVPKPPQVSGAPPPAPKIAASDSRVEKDPKDMTDAEFSKWFARKRGRTT
jgi:hypothetical protein